MTSVQRLRAGDIYGVLNGALTNTATSMSITPNVGSAPIPIVAAPNILAIILEPGTLNEDIVWVTAAALGQTTALTIVGGREGTQLAHASGVPYKHGPTVNDYNPTIRDAVWARIGTANVLDDEFNEGALDSAWIRVDTAGTNTPTYVVAADVLSISHLATGGGAVDNAGPAHAVLKSLGGRTFPVTLEIGYRLLRQYATNYQMFGLLFADGVTPTSRGVWMMPFGQTTLGAGQRTSIRSFAALNGGQTVATDGPNIESLGGFLHAQLKWTATDTFTISHSVDGVQWWPVVSNFTTGLLGGLVPTYCGFAISNWQTNQPGMAAVEYFRVV